MPDVAELGTELGIRAWSGRAVFNTSLSRGTGTPSSPISVSSSSSSSSSSSTPSASPSRPSSSLSSSSPLNRQPTPELRSDPTAQTTPTTTTTPPRPRARILYSPSPVRPPAAPRQPVHPFFAQVRVPPARTPRLVANYASTSASESASGSQSQGTSSQSQSMSTVSEFGSDEITAEMMAAVDRFSALAIDSKPASRVVRAARPSLPRLLPRASLPPSPETLRLGQTEAPDIDGLGRTAPSSGERASTAPDVSDLAAVTQRRTDTDRLTASPEPIEPTASTEAAVAPCPPEPPSALPLFSCKTPLAGHFDRPPTVVYTSDPGEADDLVSCLRGVLGFDMEWPPPGVGPVRQTTRRDGTSGYTRDGLWDPATRTYSWPQGRTAVIQVCDARTVVVFHLRGNTAPGPVLAKLIADGAHVKVGVMIRGDAHKLVRDFPSRFATSPPGGLLDLSTFARNVEPDAWKGVRSIVSMARLAARYLGVTLSKDEGVRTGAWDARMTPEQLAYAANDAYASLLIFNEINRRARASRVAVDIPTLTTSIPSPQALVSAAGPTKRAPPTTLGVSPAKSRALRLFTDGESVAQLSVMLGIKETTVQGYIVDAAQVVSVHEICVNVRRRMLVDVPDDSYTGQKHKHFLDKLRASLEDL